MLPASQERMKQNKTPLPKYEFKIKINEKNLTENGFMKK